MRVRYDDFEDYELDDVRAMRRLMHERQREGLRLSKKKRRQFRGARDDDWNDTSWDGGEDYENYEDYEIYDANEYDRHTGLS